MPRLLITTQSQGEIAHVVQRDLFTIGRASVRQQHPVARSIGISLPCRAISAGRRIRTPGSYPGSAHRSFYCNDVPAIERELPGTSTPGFGTRGAVEAIDRMETAAIYECVP
jgi:hypothetical protein